MNKLKNKYKDLYICLEALYIFKAKKSKTIEYL